MCCLGNRSKTLAEPIGGLLSQTGWIDRSDARHAVPAFMKTAKQVPFHRRYFCEIAQKTDSVCQNIALRCHA